MLAIETLREMGADTDEGLGRCLHNEQLYLRLVKMAAEDTGFDLLRDKLESRDLSAAFEVAHAMKGVMGNLSLTPLYRPISQVTELLRAGADAEYHIYLDEILCQRARLLALIGEKEGTDAT